MRIWTDKGLEIEIVRISTVALAGVDGGDGGHIIDREVEVEDLEVLLDALGMSGLGKHDDAALDVPTNHYLCSRPAVLGTDSGQYWVAE